MSEDESRQTLHRLLYRALVDIRVESQAEGREKVLHLADLFHNLPLRLEQVAQGRQTYEEAMSSLVLRAREAGLGEWLDHAIEAESKAMMAMRRRS